MPTLDQRLQRLARARLYAIVDTGYVEPERVPRVTEQLVLGGVDLIQLRAKKLPLAAIAELGKKMRAIIPSAAITRARYSSSTTIPNSSPKSARTGFMSARTIFPWPTRARRREPRPSVGKSTHSLNQAIAAEKEGADYIGVGPIYATPTKPDYVPVGPALIGRVRAAVRVPQFCIGGINEQTLPEVLAAGARRVVIVSALLKSEDIPAYCRRVKEN